jgi:hypothetical protein
LQLLVGIEGESGMESFQLMVCTPTWLSENHSKNDILMGRHLLIIFEYNYEQIINWIRSYVGTCTGNTWQEVAEKVGRLGLWEFEDYLPTPNRPINP